jgi:hypothetical protein
MKPLLRSLACSTKAVFLAGSPQLAERSDAADVCLNRVAAFPTFKLELNDSIVAYAFWLTPKTINSAGLCNDQFELSIVWLCFPLVTRVNHRKPNRSSTVKQSLSRSIAFVYRCRKQYPV